MPQPQAAPRGQTALLRALRLCADVSTDSGDIGLLSVLPIELLHAELSRRQDVPYKPACGSTQERGTYNMPLHVFALFLILGLSTLGQCVGQRISNTN